MKTNTHSEIMNISIYLNTVESGILMNNINSIKKLCEATTHASSKLEDIEHQLDSEGQHESRILRALINKLRVQLALGKINASERLDEIEKKITQSYSRIKNAGGRLERLGKKETNDVRNKIHNSWMHLKAALAIARIRLELAEEKSEAKVQSAKDELIRDFEKIRDLVSDNTEEVCKKSSKWIKSAKKTVGKRTHNVLKALKS